MYVGPVEQLTVHLRQLRGIGKSCAVLCAGGLKSAGKTADKGPLSSKAFQVRALVLLTAAIPLAVPSLLSLPAIVHQWKCRPLQNIPHADRIPQQAMQVSPSMEHLKLSASGSMDSIQSMDSVMGDPDNQHLHSARRSNLLPR